MEIPTTTYCCFIDHRSRIHSNNRSFQRSHFDGLIKEIGFSKKKFVVFSDSQSSIQLCKNPVFHDRTKHIDVRFHFIRDIVGKDVIKLEKIKTEDNPANMGTKSLPVEKFTTCLKILRLIAD